MNKLLFLLLFVQAFTFAKSQPQNRTIHSDSIPMSYMGDEIIIESFKQNNHLSIKPIAASLLTSKNIKERNITTIKDFTAFVPNLFIPDYGSKLTSPVYVRGIGSRINAPSVGLYIDGVPYFDRSAFDFNMNDIDHVEVLRGSQGTIYGRNTMGGIINVYTKSPFKYEETNLSLSAANYNNYRIDASHYGNVDKTFGYSFSGNYIHHGGYFDNQYTKKKADEMDEVSARIRLSWKIKPRLTTHLTSTYEYSDQDGYAYGVYNSDNNTVSDVDYNDHSYYRRNMSTTGLEISYVADKYKLSSQTSFQYFDGKQGIDQDFTNLSTFYVLFDQNQRMYSEEITIKSITDSRYQWLFGVFAFHQDYSYSNQIDMIAANRRDVKEISTPSKGIALYHQSVINDLLTRGLSLTLGVRYDIEKANIEAKEGDKEPMTARKSFSQVTPKASLQYSFANKNMIYTSVSKGYKSGGFNTTIETEADRYFAPEKSWNYEVGTKISLFDGFVTTDISLFYIDWSDQQISQSITQGSLLRNAGQTTSKGVEISTLIKPIANLDLQANYGYTKARFDKYEDEIKKINYNGNILPLVPTNTVSLSADYSIPVKRDWLDKVVLNGQYVGIGKLYWNEDNKAKQPYYNTVNGRVSFVKKKVSIDLWAKNITNKKYIAYYFSSMGQTFAQRGKPFTCGVNINIKF